MLETSVQVRLSSQEHNVLEVGVVDVRVHSEKSFENYFDDVHEVLREGDAESTGEDYFVVQLVFDPCHQEIDVFACTDFERCLDIVTVSPKILVLGTSTHGGTAFTGTKLH